MHPFCVGDLGSSLLQSRMHCSDGVLAIALWAQLDEIVAIVLRQIMHHHIWAKRVCTAFEAARAFNYKYAREGGVARWAKAVGVPVWEGWPHPCAYKNPRNNLNCP